MLKNKTILIISPQSWGKMLVSKHHYARELAKYGCKVYFLNPPILSGINGIQIEPEGKIENLFIVDHSLFFPYNLKFHWVSLFHFLMRFHVKRIMRTIKEPIDIIWSFDLGHLYPFSFFPESSLKVFHPVDEPLNTTALNSANGAQVIFSVTREILDKYQRYKLPAFFINHGVSEEFISDTVVRKSNGAAVRVGLSGNWTRADIDWECLVKIISENADVNFEFWGSYKANDSNIGSGQVNDMDGILNKLQTSPNVKLHGPVPSLQLATAIRQMDAFLICYDVQRDQSKGTNYHKIMEFLSTGKIVISNNVTTYHDKPELVQMVAERSDNHKLPALFKTIVKDISSFNTGSLQQTRIDFARENTYLKQIERIETLLKNI